MARPRSVYSMGDPGRDPITRAPGFSARLEYSRVVQRLAHDGLDALRRLVVGVDPGEHFRPVLKLDDHVPPSAARRLDDLAVPDAAGADSVLDRLGHPGRNATRQSRLHVDTPHGARSIHIS